MNHSVFLPDKKLDRHYYAGGPPQSNLLHLREDTGIHIEALFQWHFEML
jgi:hypothetical protein